MKFSVPFITSLQLILILILKVNMCELCELYIICNTLCSLGHAEEDAFFCFTSLMAEIRDNFCKTLDKSSLGITGLMQKLNTLLKEKDYELWNDLVSLLTFYSLL